MRNIFITALLAVSLSANAQPWLEKFEGQRPNIEEIEQQYRARFKGSTPAGEEQDVFEGKDYHFERWLYHWEGRTDANGDLVSPAKIWVEYKKRQDLIARSSSKGTSNDVNWSFHGPDNAFAHNYGIGRINVIEFHPTDTNTYLIGSPGGGIWRTTDDGNTWTVLDDFLPVLGVSDIDYNPLNPNTIYICTGDRDAGDTYSMGVFKSIDGGQTWDTTGLNYTFHDAQQTTGLVINPLDTSSLTLTTTQGIFKSFDAGKTWTNMQSGSFKQVLYNPADTNILYAAASGSIYRSADGGMNWSASSGISNTARRIEMAVTPANPAIVKLVAVKSDHGLQAIYNSTDTGKTFTDIFDDGNNCSTNILASNSKGNRCEGQGWYDLTIQISPVNENQVIVGGVNTWYSTNGGNSWKVANQWSTHVAGVTRVHADKHCHKFHPLQPGILYECNDGGVYKTAAPMSGTSIWNNLSDGLGITQFYRNAVADNASFVLGGAQDNGTKMLVGGTSKQMTGADGMDCHIDPTDSNRIYTSQQYGELRRSTDGGDNFKDIQNNIPGKPEGGWITPFLIYPPSTNILLAGYEEVYLSTDYGDNWSSISPNFNADLDRIVITPLDADYIYIMTNSASSHTIRYTTDFGNSWKVLPAIQNVHGSDILVDPRDANVLWTTYRTYSGVKVAKRHITNDTAWIEVNAGIPDIPVNCIAFDHHNQTFYIGTDLGVYYREYNDNTWKYFNNNTMPNVEVIDLGINNTTHTIWAATYGRGMWSSPTHKSTTGIANTIPLAQDVITIAPNPNYGTFHIKTDNMQIREQQTPVRIVDLTGKTVWQQNLRINNSGDATIKADLPRGTYIVEVLKENVIFAKTKMVVF